MNYKVTYEMQITIVRASDLKHANATLSFFGPFEMMRAVDTVKANCSRLYGKFWIRRLVVQTRTEAIDGGPNVRL